jgi:hypothetical protein
MQWRPTITIRNTSRATRNKLTKHSNNNTSTIRSLHRIRNEMHGKAESILHLHTTNINTVPLRAPNNSLLTPTSNRCNNRSNAASSRHRVLHTTWHNAFKLVRCHASNEPAVRCILTASLNNAGHHPRHPRTKSLHLPSCQHKLTLQCICFFSKLSISSSCLLQVPLRFNKVAAHLIVLKPLAFHALKPLPKPKYLFSKFADLRSTFFIHASLFQFHFR